MQISAENVKKLVLKMGFTPQNGKNNVYYKAYQSHNGYAIYVDFNTEKIEYYTQDSPKDSRITLGDGTTSNFSHAENFVVLECVDRLLEKGYAPSCIELEKTYPSGRGHSGRLDILVSTPEGVPYLMVECKTWGAEYEKEYKKMLKDGGQLFTYYTNDRATKYLCLYASHLSKNIEYKNAIIDVNDGWHDLSGTKDIFGHWNKNFKDNGIFESYAAPYDVKHKALTYGMLRNLKEEDGGKIYNQIMEILRHNAVSDKPNAFNKLLNLFVCKIIDENKNEDDGLQFQWLENDTDETLQMRLNDLYKEGMWRFLEIKVIDYEEKEVSDKLENIGNDDIKRWVMQMYQDTRLKKSPNFAFVEVQDEKTFQHNAKVVREIVELLQAYKFRYAQKHEFLGNFFELLLNTSMKQEAGQFFTPAPITRFIISSLPLRELVQERVDGRNSEPLPTVIDYACGSGHFLTEYMSQLQDIIDTKINVEKASPSVRNQFQSWQGFTKFLWARDTVYGIDLDNRLIKTTKVSAFFNGDGEATIVWANGLDSFSMSEEYRGKLRCFSGVQSQDNGQFDILISNPPYSVEAFKSTIKCGEESFELYKHLTENSSEIECLFIERMKQLLKIGGWAAVILPSSLLSNGRIHSKAREIIFKYFNVKAIVELGSGTFMETGTNTVILFLERRSNNDYLAIMNAIDTFFINKKDVTVVGIENAFSRFVTNVYDKLTFDDYLSLVGGNANEAMREHELFEDYAKAFCDDMYTKALEIEKEKLLYFLLTYNQNIALVKTGKKKNAKQFLGYEFSKSRGHEGMKWLPGGTMLYDEGGDLLSPHKANSYIYHSFLGKRTEIDDSIAKNISYGRMSGFIEYGTSKFDKVVNLNAKIRILSKYPFAALGDIAEIYNGGTPDTNNQDFWNGDIQWATLVDTKQKYLYGTKKTISEDGLKSCNAVLLPVNTVLFSSRATIGDVSIAKTATATNQGYKNFVCNEDVLAHEYLYYILKHEAKAIEALAGGMTYPEISKSAISSYKIPLPPLDVQQKIIAEMNALENEYDSCFKKISQLQDSLLRDDYFLFYEKRLFDISLMIRRGKSAKYGQSNIQIIKSGQARGYREFDFSQRHFVSEGFASDERNLIKGDILINSTGVGTAGRVTLFDLEGDFVVDSHITIVRFDRAIVQPKYALYAFAKIGFDKIESMASGQSGQIELSLDTIKGIKIPVPSLEKQTEIIAELESCETEIDELTSRMVELKAAKSDVLQKYL